MGVGVEAGRGEQGSSSLTTRGSVSRGGGGRGSLVVRIASSPTSCGGGGGGDGVQFLCVGFGEQGGVGSLGFLDRPVRRGKVFLSGWCACSWTISLELSKCSDHD